MLKPNELSFLPDDFLAKRDRRRTNWIGGGLLIASVAAVSVAFTYATGSLRASELRRADVERRYTDAANRIKLATKMQQKQQTLARQAELTAALLEKVPRSNVLAAVTNALPPGVSLTEVELVSTKREAALPPETALDRRMNPGKADALIADLSQAPVVYDVSLRLSGRSESNAQLAAYMRSLDASDVIADVVLVGNQQDEKERDASRKFVLETVISAQLRTGLAKGEADRAASVQTATVE